MIKVVKERLTCKNGLTGVYESRRTYLTRNDDIPETFLGYYLGSGTVGTYEEARTKSLKTAAERYVKDLHEEFGKKFPNVLNDPQYAALCEKTKKMQHAFYMKLRENELPVEEPQETDVVEEYDSEYVEPVEYTEIKKMYSELWELEKGMVTAKRVKVVSSDNE